MGAKNFFTEKCILMAESKGKVCCERKSQYLGLLDGRCSSLAVPRLMLPGQCSVFFFLHLGLLCGGGGGGLWFIHFGATEKDLGYFGLLDCRPFLHRHTNVDELGYGIAVQSTDKKTQSKSEAREATKKREGPCATSVLNSESGSVQPTALLLCNLPVSWQTPSPVHAKSPPGPSHLMANPPPPLTASQLLGPSHLMACTPPLQTPPQRAR